MDEELMGQQQVGEGEEQAQQQATAIQHFMEFTGNPNESDARRLLQTCGWDLERAINIFFMRGQHQQQGHAGFEALEEVEAIHPPMMRRISHFNRHRDRAEFGQAIPRMLPRQPLGPAQLDDSVQVVDERRDSDIQMLEDDAETTQQNGAGRAGTGHAVDEPAVGVDGDRVRAPIPAVQGIMLAQSYSETYKNGREKPSNPFFGPFKPTEDGQVEEVQLDGQAASSSTSAPPSRPDFKQQRAAHRVAMERYHHMKRAPQYGEASSHDGGNEAAAAVQAVLQPANQENHGPTATGPGGVEITGGFAQAGGRRDLRILFRPPVDILFFGDWDQALQVARQKNAWLLVNVQDSQDFASAVLNRDIWSSETVREVIRPNFLFWQIYHDSADGVRIRGYYGFNQFPVIFIVDPRTGEEVKKLQAPDAATFLDNLTTFLARYPTFEARDREFREMAIHGGRTSTPPTSPTTMARDQMTTSPAGKKRKQPGTRAGSRGTLGSSGEEENVGMDESAREANLQAKKMKRVVTISDDSNAPSTSSTSTQMPSTSVAGSAIVKIDPEEWHKWVVPAQSNQLEQPRVDLQLRLVDGQKRRFQLWAQAPLSALFSLISSLGLPPVQHQLVLDFPRREFTSSSDPALLSASLSDLGFGRQQMVIVEKREG